MSKPLAAHDLMANHDRASLIQDLPYFNTTTDLDWVRSPITALTSVTDVQLPSLTHLNIAWVCDGSYWILLPEDDILKELLAALKEKKPWNCTPAGTAPETGFNLMAKEDWKTSGLLVFKCAWELKQTCSMSFFNTDRSFDNVRPVPAFWIDDSKPTPESTQAGEEA
ncbi:hypothetical protein H0H87_006683 [Tephrocybe sp. NHM501043]|nr:hypothetical protein H0H87_006683 [Tephrocybe sp. NHM501043]